MHRPSFCPPIARSMHVAVAAAAALFFVPFGASAADPTTADCLAANNNAIGLRNEHKLRDARAQLLICAAASCPADVQKECLRRVDEVNAQIPTILFEAKDAATGQDLSAVRVTMDGQPFADQLEGTALSVDPGEHTFVFETEGQAPVTRQFVLQEAQKDRRESIEFGIPPPAAPPVPQPTLSGAEPFAPPPPPIEARRRLGSQRLAAIVVAGVGVVGLGVGGAFGLIAMSKKNDAENACPGQCASESGVTAWSDAKTAGNVSTALFVVGGVGVATGAVLWLTARPARRFTPQVGLGPGSVQLKGTW